MNKKVLNQKKLNNQIKEGMKILSDMVGRTLGPGGLPILIERVGLDGAHRPLKPLVTKDGVTVARNIQVKDRVLNTIISSVIEVAEKTNIEAGDGTTTAIVLANALYKEGLKYMIIGERPENIYKEVCSAAEKVVKRLEEIAIRATSVDTIKSIATISANGEGQVGEVVSSAFDRVGEEGVITLEEGYDSVTRLKIEEGFQIERGLLRPEVMYTHPGQEQCILQNCAIIIYDGEISSEKDLIPLMEKITNNWTDRNSFLIIARDVVGAALNTMIVNRMEERITNFAIIKAPHVGHVRTQMLQDIAIATGGRMIIPDANGSPAPLRSATLEDLGYSKKIVSGKYRTLIYEGAGDKEEIIKRVGELKEAKGMAESPYDAQILENRIASLTGGIAVIQVGGKTELEMKEKKDRIEDALNATRAAIQEGIIPGGGATLYHISEELDVNKLGERILREAIRAPLRQMVENLGENSDVVISNIEREKINYKNIYSVGYNGSTKKVEDMILSNIIDPVKVTKTALRNAVSISNLLLTCGGAIVLDEELKVDRELNISEGIEE